jgi:HAD superfamily hydrolase (TIGR01509 family)
LRNFDGIIFDIDGTLTATHDLIFATFNHISEKYFNKKMSKEDILSMFGPTEDVILKEWMKDKYEDARETYYSFYQSKHNSMADVFPGLTETINLIKSKGIPLGIYTGKGKDSSFITLKEIDLLHQFDLIITGDDVAEHKPSPEGINLFVDKFNLVRERVLMVGDAHVDVIAARDAGVKIASVLWDSYHKDQVLELNPDFIFYNVVDFSKFIKDNI